MKMFARILVGIITFPILVAFILIAYSFLGIMSAIRFAYGDFAKKGESNG